MASRSPFTTPPLFCVQITEDANAPEYEWIEVLDDGSGTLVEKSGGRYGSATNPGIDVLGVGFAVGDVCLCRTADGAAGLTWELLPISAPGDIPAGEVQQNIDYVVTSDNTWEDMSAGGVSTITLPSEGLYRVYGKITFSALATFASSTAFLAARIYDVDEADSLPGSGLLFDVMQVSGRAEVATLSFSCHYEASGPNTLRWEAFRQSATGLTWIDARVGTVVAIDELNVVLGYERLTSVPGGGGPTGPPGPTGPTGPAGASANPSLAASYGYLN